MLSTRYIHPCVSRTLSSTINLHSVKISLGLSETGSFFFTVHPHVVTCLARCTVKTRYLSCIACHYKVLAVDRTGPGNSQIDCRLPKQASYTSEINTGKNEDYSDDYSDVWTYALRKPPCILLAGCCPCQHW